MIEETKEVDHNWNGSNFDDMFDNFSYDNVYQVNNVTYGDIPNDEEEFAADTAASDHFVTNNRQMYNKVQPTRTTAMTTDGKKTTIDETGNVDLVCDSGTKLTLNGANCVNKFKKNLISVARCVDDGRKVTFNGKNLMLMSKNGQTLEFKRRPDNLYCLKAKKVPNGAITKVYETTKATKIDINEAHDKFGHPCEEILHQTANIFGLELVGKLNSCEGCARSKAKQKKVSHTTETNETFIGERFYLDQSGPYDKSWNGKTYLQCCIDGYTRVSFVNFSNTKDTIVEWFETICDEMIARGTPIKHVRADPAGENKELINLANKHGMKVEYTLPGTPQMNGKVEIRQTVLIHKALAGMHQANLNETIRITLWNEAVNYANDIANLTWSRTTKRSPYIMINKKNSKLGDHVQPLDQRKME